MIYVITQRYHISPHVVEFNGDLTLVYLAQAQAHPRAHLATRGLARGRGEGHYFSIVDDSWC